MSDMSSLFFRPDQVSLSRCHTARMIASHINPDCDISAHSLSPADDNDVDRIMSLLKGDAPIAGTASRRGGAGSPTSGSGAVDLVLCCGDSWSVAAAAKRSAAAAVSTQAADSYHSSRGQFGMPDSGLSALLQPNADLAAGSGGLADLDAHEAAEQHPSGWSYEQLCLDDICSQLSLPFMASQITPDGAIGRVHFSIPTRTDRLRDSVPPATPAATFGRSAEMWGRVGPHQGAPMPGALPCTELVLSGLVGQNVLKYLLEFGAVAYTLQVRGGLRFNVDFMLT